MDDTMVERRLGLGGIASELGVPRLTVWFWAKTGRLPPPSQDGDGAWWTPTVIHRWALHNEMADRVRLDAWPTATTPATYLGTVDLDQAVAQHWQTSTGILALLWPTPDLEHEPIDDWSQVLHRRWNTAAVVWPMGDFSLGPSLVALRPGLPPGDRRRHEPGWSDLARVLGQPAPYWTPQLLTPHLVREWTPDAPAVTVPATPELGTGPLLRLATTYDPDQPANQTLVNLARVVHARTTDTARTFVGLAAQHLEPHEITIAAQPMPVPDASLADLDETIRRAGWLDILARTDALATTCVLQARMWNSGKDMPFGNPARITLTSPQAVAWAERLQPTPRTAAHVIIDSRGKGTPMIDPATDAPVVRFDTGSDDETEATVFRATIPQRLPATSPLSELILSGPIWVRTDDNTIYPAPRDSYYGLSWGYPGGSGPGALAVLIDRLLDDITAKAADTITGAPEGLTRLTATKVPDGTVITRAQLMAAWAGRWLPLIVTDPDDPDGEQQ